MHFFIVPTTNCNSNCNYCYSKNTIGHSISKETLTEAASFINRMSKEQNRTKISITFHGGEPLLADKSFYQYAIPYIKETLGCEANIGIQSNLWLLNEMLCQIFKKYNVGVGTSLDGPIDINDSQRGTGYYNKTFSGIELLKKQSMHCRCIATFTKPCSEKIEEVFDFFIAKGLHFDVHAAIKPIDYQQNDNMFLTSKEFGGILIRLLDLYLKHLPKLKISTLDTLIKNVANRKSGLCTFTKCLGEYYAISPEGELYTCNRFVGNKDFCIGNIRDIHSFSDINKSEAWKRQQSWHDWIDEECKECLFKNYCHGGCPYSAFASGKGAFIKDPHCEAYKMIYNYIIDKGAAEFFSYENMVTLSQTHNSDNEISFQSNPILYLMKEKPHPYDIVQTSKKIITAALLGKTSNPKQTTENLYRLGIVTSIDKQFSVVDEFYNELSQPSKGFNNLYLHITSHCNLSCSHCYSYNGNKTEEAHLSPEIIVQLIKDANGLFFKKIIFTGGEPLLYRDFEILLDKLHLLKNKKKIPTIVLRTNLASKLNPALIEKISTVFDQIVVSIDGSEEIHDRQRGNDAYQKTMNNLALFDLKTIEKKVTFACVLNQQSLSECELENAKLHINSLKTQFAVNEIRFLPLLPLGRAGHFKTQRNKAEMLNVNEWMSRKYYFRTSCGLGQSVMIESNGNVYPCHVLKETQKQIIGNINKDNLQDITQKTVFDQLRNINVNTNSKCHKCAMRYLCGGVCKIWENQDCSDLYNRAKHLIDDSLRICNVSPEESGLMN